MRMLLLTFFLLAQTAGAWVPAAHAGSAGAADTVGHCETGHTEHGSHGNHAGQPAQTDCGHDCQMCVVSGLAHLILPVAGVVPSPLYQARIAAVILPPGNRDLLYRPPILI